MTKAFSYNANPARIVFGAGALRQLPQEAERLAVRRVLVLSTPGQAHLAARCVELLAAQAASVFTEAAMHVPADVARAACDEADARGADCVVAIGGGSTTGLGKAIALEQGLPVIAIPTTYAGSEVSPIYGVTEGGLKRTGRDPKVLPRVVIYDPELSLTLPLATTVTSAINAIAHAAEGLYAPDGNPIVALMAEEGIRACAAALPPLQRDPRDVTARGDALYGAWLCGTVLGSVTMGLHHKLCHTLGGSFNLPHAETHTVVLPHALAYNAAAAPEAMTRIARALGGDDAPTAAQQLARVNGAPTSLAAIGMKAVDLDSAAELATKTPYPNPRPLERAALRELLQRAFDGAEPSA